MLPPGQTNPPMVRVSLESCCWCALEKNCVPSKGWVWGPLPKPAGFFCSSHHSFGVNRCVENKGLCCGQGGEGAVQFTVTEAWLEGAEGGAGQDRQGCFSGSVAQWRETGARFFGRAVSKLSG